VIVGSTARRTYSAYYAATFNITLVVVAVAVVVDDI
jgi:hypothetical protein